MSKCLEGGEVLDVALGCSGYKSCFVTPSSGTEQIYSSFLSLCALTCKMGQKYRPYRVFMRPKWGNFCNALIKKNPRFNK